MSKILLLEDDLSLIDGLSYALKKQGYSVDVCRTLAEADELLSGGGQAGYDLLLLDVSLPDGSGFDLCKKVRQTSKAPIIFLTASDEEVSIIMGLDIGGDDYITKPFKLGVLISRIGALLRRAQGSGTADTEVTSNGITVSLLRGQAYKGGAALDLTAAEYRLLCLLMQNPGVVLTRDKILGSLWDSGGSFVEGNTLAVYIRRLRTKIEDDPGSPKMLVTVRGMGYKWQVWGGSAEG
jgi:DNA-binding response OmpR family regulator